MIGPAGTCTEFELGQEIAPRPLGGESGEARDQLIAIFESIGIGAVARVVRDLGCSQCRTELGELVVVAGGDDDVSVRDREYLVRHDVRVGIADALGHLAGDEIVERLVGEDPDLAVDERRVHEAAASGPLALGERGENSDRGINSGEDIRHRHAGALRLAVRRARDIHDAAHALGHEIIAGTCGVGPGLSETGD